MKRNRWVYPLLGAAALLLASCSEADAPTGTGSPSAVTSVDQLANSADSDRQAEHQLLLDHLRAIRDSLKDERELHREEFKQARKDWGLFQKEWRQLRKQGGTAELLACEPQEYTAAAELIGPNGGTIKVGPHELRIPAGALDHEVIISAVVPVSNRVEVQLQPEGLQFATPARLKLSYSQCVQPPEWIKLFIVYLGVNDQVLEVTVSRDKKGLKTVVGWLEHFSRYAIAW
jgi:hypothetical protein